MSRGPGRRRATGAIAAATLAPALPLLAGCATKPLATTGAAAGAAPAAGPGPAARPATATATSAFITPNPALTITGIPPIPASIAERTSPWGEFRGHGFVGWHPVRREMLVVHRRAGENLTQLRAVTSPLAEPVPLTRESEPVSSGSWEPREGRYLVYLRASGGDEAAQLHRLDVGDSAASSPGTGPRLTDPSTRHGFGGWIRGRGELLYTSVPLDRTAAGGTRSDLTTRLTRIDPLDPAARRVVAELPGTGWSVGAIARDDRRVALLRFRTPSDSEVWLLDLDTGERTKLLPRPGEAVVAAHLPLAFTRGGRALWFLSDRAGEFTELMRFGFDTGVIERTTAAWPHDIDGFSASDDGRFVALRVNVDGRDELRLLDAASGTPLPVPPLPAAEGGRVTAVAFDRVRGELAIGISGARGPSELHSLLLRAPRAPGLPGPLAAASPPERWTRPFVPPGIDPSRFAGQQVVRWPSFDGRTISGLLSNPPARFAGRRPVIIDIHGGPVVQAKVGFLGRANWFVEEAGIALIQPNVRGSDGFGRSFLALDDGRLREDAVKDIGALLDWIATQPRLDASRVLVMGGSYGGYMTLASAIHFGDRLAGAVAEVAISHFVTFLERTESYRRDLRRVEYGDERDPAMRAFLHSISPLSNAQRITKPLFVVHGRNDPRVPVGEAEQIAAAARARGVEVWTLIAENEGHGFARKENADFRFFALVKFVERVFGPG